MAVFRSDQAQITFAAEPAQGADMERITATVAAQGYIATANAASAGDTSITVTAGTYAVGNFIRIGDSGQNNNTEVRRIEHLGTTASPWVLHLDRPLAFAHAGGGSSSTANGVDVASGAITNGRKYITFMPGIYETVEVPDPEMAIEPRYFLGTQSKRNFFQAYKGQHSFSGSIGDMIHLNGWPLRFPIGSVLTVASATTMGDATTGSAVSLSGGTNKGDVIIPQNLTSILAVGDYVAVEFVSTALPTTKMEVRRVSSMVSGNTELNYPLMFAHSAGVSVKKVDPSATGFFYRHHIMETVDLDTVSWHVHMRDSSETAANDFDRRYVGGMIGAMTIGAEEGGLLTCGWDSAPFMDVLHNQKLHTSTSLNTFAGDLPGYAMMHSITATDVNKLPGGGVNLDTVSETLAATTVTDPYYFSRGGLKFNGQTFARIRNFSLTVSNNEEPRYYIQQRFGRHRGPNEIREQQREYTMTATVALPDTGAAATASSMNVATALFKELLLEGDYGTDANPNMAGMSASLEFVRGTNDRIVIDIPGTATADTAMGVPGVVTANSSALTPGEGGNAQGMFLRSAAHAVSGDNPIQTDVDFLIRNIKITIDDAIAVYP